MTGRLVFSDLDTTVARLVKQSTTMSRKPLWGATASTGASAPPARRPLTRIHRKPTQKKTARLRNCTMPLKSQNRQPLKIE